ncbi:radical SAM/SPASM domain-containing protein [Peptostreptococcus sp. D1]|uniref:radical SAM/SPASM domain-containing protein n=1 Tax=Peptostreptococcus sp. D1 TaxID=72304 RepID=UPI0008E35F93|nr:radical SAM protein [Peptostreptococcus sp. D1]SFE91154.1 uncharacterized protein SAMN02910278_02045 [Peptostreptococcus sp. D1]
MNFTVVVTDDCNLRCSYCYEKNKKYYYMTEETAIKIVEYVYNAIERRVRLYPEEIKYRNTVVFHGGEPLLNFKVIKCITEGLQKFDYKFRYEMTTNGTIYSDEISSFIKNNNIELSVSIDGTKYYHDKNRKFVNGNGSFDLVISNISKFIKRDINIRARITINPESIVELCNSINYLSEKGINLFAISENFYNEDWYEDDIRNLKLEIEKIRKLDKEILTSFTDRNDVFKIKSDCFGGLNSIVFDPVGTIYPCVFSLNNNWYKLGDLNSNNEDVTKKAMNLHEWLEMKPSLCKSCGIRETCSGYKCKILNNIINRNNDTSPPVITCNIKRLLLEISMGGECIE